MNKLCFATSNCMLENDIETPANDSQRERLPHVIHSLGLVPFPSLFFLNEVHSDTEGNCGEAVARGMDCGPGKWDSHSRGAHENVGMFGPLVDQGHTDVGFHELNRGRGQQLRKATIAVVEKVNLAVAGVHLTYGFSRQSVVDRWHEARSLMDILDSSDYGAYANRVVMGDFNGLSFEPARKLLEYRGLNSVTGSAAVRGRRRPYTVNIAGQERHLKDIERRALGLPLVGLSPDDVMYSDGLTLLDGGMVPTASDHNVVWGSFELEVTDGII